MASIPVHKLDAQGKATKSGTVDLPAQYFGIEPNTDVMHQVVTAQLAAARSGTQSTKTRAEVRGGGAKPWRQKGTGRARQGSIRSAQWEGGGIAHGPKPRKYDQRTPKKMVRLALLSALSDRAKGDQIKVVDEWRFEKPLTKQAISSLESLGLRDENSKPPRVLIIMDHIEQDAWKSFRNLGERVQLILPRELNTYDVLVNDTIVFSKRTLEATLNRLGNEASEAEVGGEA